MDDIKTQELLRIYREGRSTSLNNEANFSTYARSTIEYYSYLLGVIHAQNKENLTEEQALKAITTLYEERKNTVL